MNQPFRQQNLETPILPKMLTLDEVAAYLDKPKGWLYANWRDEGIPFKRIGNHLRCRLGDLDDWIDRQAAA